MEQSLIQDPNKKFEYIQNTGFQVYPNGLSMNSQNSETDI
jgi:hypothetical protein